MRSLTLRTLALAALPALGACADGGAAPTGIDGPAVQVAVAPLTLPGVTDVCYGLTVYNGDPDGAQAPDTVWSKQGVCSVDYGNADGGDVTYIGTCDANGNNNFVELVLESVTTTGGLLDDQITANAEGGDGDADFENPCTAAAPCKLDFPCVENQDTLVEFNLTIMRDAQQGFFDVAVNFEDIFCSAKLDSCYGVTMTEVPYSRIVEFGIDTFLTVYLYQAPNGQLYNAVWSQGSWRLYGYPTGQTELGAVVGPESPPPATLGALGTTLTLVTVPSATGGTPMGLLFGPDNDRDHTAVAALACTAGADSAGTELLMIAPQVQCNGGAVSFTLPLDGLAAGNHTLTVGSYTLRYALYFGDEQLQCNGGSCQKIYYNIALNIAHLAEQGLADCRFLHAASAHEIGDGVVDQYGQLADPNGIYPAIFFGLDTVMGTALTSATAPLVPLCTAQPLNGTNSQVVTTYVEGSAFGGGGGVFQFSSQGGAATAFPSPP